MTVGVAIVGHGQTASHLLQAARGILANRELDDVIAVDAGAGENAGLNRVIGQALEGLDQGQGVVVMVDLWGASPCQCARKNYGAHEVVVLSGLNLAMLLKLASLDRGALSPVEVAEACANSAQRAVSVWNNTRPTAEASGCP